MNQVNITLTDNKLAITFDFRNGFDRSLVDKVKSLSDRRYNPDTKMWLVPIRIVNEVMAKFPNATLSPQIREIIQKQKELAEMSNKSASDFDVPNIKVPGLLPYQKAGVEFADKANGRVLIADEMGLGKTLQALAYLALHPELRPAIIVCPASLKLNWAREIEKWLDTEETVFICNGTKPQLEQASIYIINYDILATRVKAGKDEKNRIYNYPWVNILLSANPKNLISDESHYLKNEKALRTKAFKLLQANIPHLTLLTGTPMTNRPKELWPLLNLIAPAHWDNFFQYGLRYCKGEQTRWGWDFSGYSNLPELHEKIKPYVIRRTKEQVLKELPPKRYADIVLELDPKARKEYNQVLRETQDMIWEARINGESIGAKILTQIEKLKQASVSGKMPQIVEWVENFLDSDEKLVIMCTHRFVVDTLIEQFKGVATKVVGGLTDKQKQEAIDNFQDNNEVKLFIGNIQAAGTGLTLTAASNLVFIEFPWMPGEFQQASDRIHRIGQASSVTIWSMIGASTVDEKIIKLLSDKAKVIDTAIDGQDIEQKSILDELIEELVKF